MGFLPMEKYGRRYKQNCISKTHARLGRIKSVVESEGACIPPTIKEHPILLLLFLCVYPHRMNAEIMRWLDTQMPKTMKRQEAIKHELPRDLKDY